MQLGQSIWFRNTLKSIHDDDSIAWDNRSSLPVMISSISINVLQCLINQFFDKGISIGSPRHCIKILPVVFSEAVISEEELPLWRKVLDVVQGILLMWGIISNFSTVLCLFLHGRGFAPKVQFRQPHFLIVEITFIQWSWCARYAPKQSNLYFYRLN